MVELTQRQLRSLSRTQLVKAGEGIRQRNVQEAQLKAEYESRLAEQQKQEAQLKAEQESQQRYIEGYNTAIEDSKDADWRWLGNETPEYVKGYKEVMNKYYKEQARYGSVETTYQYGTEAEKGRAIQYKVNELIKKYPDLKAGEILDLAREEMPMDFPTPTGAKPQLVKIDGKFYRTEETPVEEKTGSQEFAEQVEKYKKEGMKSYRPPTKIEIAKDILTGIGQTTYGIARFEQQAITKFLAGGTLIGKEQAKRDYGLNQTDIENLYGNKTIVSGSEIINYKYFKPTAIEEKELGTAGKIAQAGTVLAFVGLGAYGGYKSYQTYRSTGATKTEAVKSVFMDASETISPFKPKTSEIVVKTGTPREVKKSLEFSKTQYTDKGIITDTKASKIWEIPTEVQIKYAPTLFGEVKPPKTIATLKNYQYIYLSGKFRTTSFGNQFVTTGNVGRKVLTYQEIPEKVTQFGITKKNVLTYNLQAGTGGGFSQQVKKGMISNILKGKPYRADVNTFKKSLDLNSQVIEGLTEVKLSYPEGKEAYSFLGKGKGISFGSGEFKFKNLATAKYEFATKQTPAKFSAKLLPAGRSSIARGYSISAPTEIYVDIKKLPDEEGKLKEYLVQLTKGESRATLFGGNKFAISTEKTIDVTKTPFNFGGGGGKGRIDSGADDIGLGGGGENLFGEMGLKKFKMLEDTTYLSNIGFIPISSSIQVPTVSKQIQPVGLMLMGTQAQTKAQSQAQAKTQAQVQTQAKVLTQVQTQVQNQIQTQVQTQAKAQVLAQVQTQAKAQTQVKTQAKAQSPLSFIFPRGITKIRTPISPPPSIIKRIKQPMSLTRKPITTREIFEALSKRYGKEISLGKFGTQTEAEIKLKGFLKGTLGASGKIKRGEELLKFGELKEFRTREFAPGKRDIFKVVQQRGFRLGTKSEVREIFGEQKKKKRSKVRWW